MSSPSSSLRKIKRSPLPGQRSVPFRHPGSVKAEGPPQPSAVPTSSHTSILEGIKHSTSQSSRNGVPSDSQLLGSMATRLAQVERELLAAKREIIDRDNLIRQLRERVSVLERSCNSPQQKELQMKCLALQNQIDEMEEFLNDYGMMWVGGASPAIDQSDGSVWMPDDSVARKDDEVSVNYDLVIQNVKELNVLAGEGESDIESTAKGAQLKRVDPVPLTLYKNGVVMFSGPFRPYSDPSTSALIRDLSDGYFPSELQSRFPEGIPLQLTDCRDTVYRTREYRDFFPGSGQPLGGTKGPSKLLGERQSRGHDKEVWHTPGPKLSVEQFLSQLPSSVVRGGRVVDVRSGISEMLKGSPGHVTLVETPVLQEIKSRLDVSDDLRPPTPAHLTTLRIKSENGDQMYILKMKYHDTIGEVRQHIDRLRPAGSLQSYLLKSSFPPQTFTDAHATLEQCGLIPTANLFMCQNNK